MKQIVLTTVTACNAPLGGVHLLGLAMVIQEGAAPGGGDPGAAGVIARQALGVSAAALHQIADPGVKGEDIVATALDMKSAGG